MGVQTVRFAPEATYWLGIWLDSTLTLAKDRRRRIGKARHAEARLRRIVNKYGVPPASARNLQMAIAQGTMLYAAELTFNGRECLEGEYQKAIHRIGRATLGAFQSTPLGIVAAGSSLARAKALLDHRFHLRTNKEVFDVEVFAICTLDKWPTVHHLLRLNSGIDRIRVDTLGPGQRFAVAALEVCSPPCREWTPTKAVSPGAQGSGWPVLPATVRARSDRVLPLRQDPKDR